MTKWIVHAIHTLTQAERLCIDMVRRNAHTFGSLGQAYGEGGGMGGVGGLGGGCIMHAVIFK